jgi:enoyl-[acyl-carrier-protein] reductase (NADH)
MEVIDLAGRRGLVVGVASAYSLAWSARPTSATPVPSWP